jgi:glycopeptide antibiotics resistance protein
LLKLGFLNYHVVDINDVMLNALGVFTGYVLYLFCRWLLKVWQKKRKAD